MRDDWPESPIRGTRGATEPDPPRVPDVVILHYPPLGHDPYREQATAVVVVTPGVEGLVWGAQTHAVLADAGLVGERLTGLPEFVHIFSHAPGCYFDEHGKLVCYN